jgi:hypothetical protein
MSDSENISRENKARRRSSAPHPPQPKALDGGYGWVIVLASFINHIIVDGIGYTFGVFYVEFLDYFGESQGKTSFVGSLQIGVCLGSGMLIADWRLSLQHRRKLSWAARLEHPQ